MTYETLLKHDLLTADEERDLTRRIKDGDEEALDQLIRHNLRLVNKCIQRYYTPDMATERDDLMQEGIIGLITAARKFDPERGHRFTTYATFWIRQKIQRCALTSGPIRRTANPHLPRTNPTVVRNHQIRQAPVDRLDKFVIGRKGDEASTLGELIPDESPSVEDQALSNIEVERILKTLRLNPRSEKIIRDWLSGLTRRDAQQLNGVSRSYIDTILDNHKWRLEI